MVRTRIGILSYISTMKAIETLKPLLSQLTRDELISLATFVLTLAEARSLNPLGTGPEADINSLFENPAFRKLMDKDLKEMEDSTNLIPFTLESLRKDIAKLKHG